MRSAIVQCEADRRATEGPALLRSGELGSILIRMAQDAAHRHRERELGAFAAGSEQERADPAPIGERP
jgi:hypothetical protein